MTDELHTQRAAKSSHLRCGDGRQRSIGCAPESLLEVVVGVVLEEEEFDRSILTWSGVRGDDFVLLSDVDCCC